MIENYKSQYRSSSSALSRNHDVGINPRLDRLNSFLGVLYTEESATKYQDYASVQYFEIVGRTNISTDAVDKSLRCIRMAWDHVDSKWEAIPGNYFGF